MRGTLNKLLLLPFNVSVWLQACILCEGCVGCLVYLMMLLAPIMMCMMPNKYYEGKLTWLSALIYVPCDVYA